MIPPNSITYLTKYPGILFSACSQIDIMSHYLDFYIESGVESVSKDGFDDMKKLISFCGAFASFISFDGVFGITVSLPGKERKCFCAFDMAKRTFVARSHKWFPKEYDINPRVAVQKISEPSDINSLSMVDCVEEPEDGEVINKLMERYLAVHGDGIYRAFESSCQYVVIKSSAGVDPEKTENIYRNLKKDLPEMIEKCKIKQKHSFSFGCGCDKNRVSAMFSVVSAEDMEYLFSEGDTIEAECPRCGFKYSFERGDFEKD